MLYNYDFRVSDTMKNTMKPTSILFAIAGIVLTTSAASAATLSGIAVSGGNYQWPTLPLLADNEQTSSTVGSGTAHDLKQGRNQGMTFTVTQNGTIDLIAMNFESFSSGGNADFTFNFFEVQSATNPTQVGATIDTVTVTAADVTAAGFANGDEGTLVFDVTDTAVTMGGTYALQFITTNNNYIVKWRNDTDGYTGGQPFGDDFKANGYNFGVYGAVPEPSTAALLGLGGLALILRRRR